MQAKRILLERLWDDARADGQRGDPDRDMPLAVFIADSTSDGMSWRRVADEIARSTGVTVSHEALRQWYGPAEARAS